MEMKSEVSKLCTGSYSYFYEETDDEIIDE
jgi:hypothetical protein